MTTRHEDIFGELPSGSEDENLSDSDDEWIPEKENNKSYEEASSDSENTSEEDEVVPVVSDKKKKEKIKYNWTTVSADEDPLPFPTFTPDPSEPEPEIGRAIHYFQLYFTDELLDNIVEQSNLYAVQTDANKPLQLKKKELEIFLGTVVYMSIYGLPRHRMYWSNACRIPKVSDAMSRRRWEAIKINLHFNNNNLIRDRNDPNRDKLFKLRPFLDGLLKRFTEHKKPQMLCIDEQIIPYKGKSSLRQYNPKKPVKWGYKVFVMCDCMGLVHNFEVYTGTILSAPNKQDIGASGNIVLRLASIVPSDKNHLLYFDNWFSSISLLLSLHEDGIEGLGTIRKERVPGIKLSDDKIMKKSGRGTYEEYKSTIDDVDIRILKWFDNKGVLLVSTFCGAQPLDTVQRFDKKSKSTITVNRPNMIQQYNKFMGGVDLLDGLISYYRISLKSKKWYLKIFFHFIDLCIVNAWIRYRSDMLEAGLQKKDIMDSLAFRAEIAEALCLMGTSENGQKRGRPSSVEMEFEVKKKRGPAKPIPQLDVTKWVTFHLRRRKDNGAKNQVVD